MSDEGSIENYTDMPDFHYISVLNIASLKLWHGQGDIRRVIIFTLKLASPWNPQTNYIPEDSISPAAISFSKKEISANWRKLCAPVRQKKVVFVSIS